jgi:hypothetical protein
MADKFRLDKKGIADLLKSDGVAAHVGEAAAAVAEAVTRLSTTPANQGYPPPIPVHQYETDRAAFSVSAPAGLQAVHGVLTAAIVEAGLEVGQRGK